MKPKTIIASATITTLCTVYLVRFNEVVNQTVGAPSKNELAFVSTTPTETINLTTDVSSSNLDNALKGLKTKKTIVTVDNSAPRNVYGKKGTVLYLPPNIFQDSKGKAYTGMVRIELEECYDVSDMLAAKLSTTSNGKLLETAGMVNIKAYAGSEKLELRQGAELNIYFPKNGEKKNDYQLFYGEWLPNDIINWKLAGNSQPLPENAPEASSTSALTADNNTNESANDVVLDDAYINEETDLEIVQEFVPEAGQRKLKEDDNCFLHIAKSYLRRGTQVSEMDYFNWKLMNGQTLNQWFVSNFNPDINMLEDFCLNGLRSQITFLVDEQGKFKDYYISKTSITEYDRAIANFLRTMPPLDLTQLMPDYKVDHACVLTFGTARGTQGEGYVQQFKAKHTGDPNKPMTNVDAASLDYFVFSSSELGWINCDRFYEEVPMVEYNVLTNTPECTMSMVFTDINSVLKGVPTADGVLFENVPANREVKIVGIRANNHKAEMAVTTSNTTRETTTLNEFKPVSINAMQAEFKKPQASKKNK